MTRLRTPSLLLLLLLSLALIACSSRDDDGDGDDGGPDETATTPAATNTATVTPTPTPRPGKELAERLAQSPEYFIYRVGNGDTLALIADMFDGISDGTDEGFLEEIKDLNQLTATGSLPTGYEVAIPLRLPTADSLFQSNSVAATLASLPGPGAEFLVPGVTLRDILQGRVTLYRLQIENGDAPGEGRGFYAEYVQTDRLAIKGGELDREARISGDAFITAGGSLADQLTREHPGAYVFRRSTTSYAIAVTGQEMPDPASIGAGLVVPAP